MKNKLLLLIIIFGFSFIMKAQQGCLELEKQFKNQVENFDNEHAITLWSDIKTQCPKYSEKNYLLANMLLQREVDNSNASNLATNTTELTNFYILYDKNFPTNTNGNIIKTAMLYYKTKMGDDQKINQLLNLALQKNSNQFTKVEPLDVLLQSTISNYQQKNISFDNLIEKYIEIDNILEINKDKFIDQDYTSAKAVFLNNFEAVTTINSITKYAENNFETKKTNQNWLANVAKLLSLKKSGNIIFEKVALSLHEMNPTATSAKYLGDYNLKTRNTTKAVQYYETAIATDTNPIEKDRIANLIATIFATTNIEKAVSMCEIAIESNPSNARNYIFLASLYDNSIDKCATDDLQKSALYKLASNTVLIAAEKETRYKASVEKLSKEYLAKMPVKTSQKTVQIVCFNKTVQL